MNFDKRELFGTDDKPIKLAQGETLISFMKFKRKLFVMTTKKVYEIVEIKKTKEKK